MSWTHPMCDECWRQTQGERVPVRVRDPEIEQCCRCGVYTHSGIFIRADPQTVTFPSKDKD